MPLLHKKTFMPEPIPGDLRPDEEVFVCQATKEVFRDYEKFFNRHFLCNSLVWSCELTGQSNLTYTQALESEREAQKLLDSLPECYQRASLALIHHTKRTNVRTLAEEICSFFRERFIVGEEVEFVQISDSGSKVVSPVRVMLVIPPQPKSPLKVPVIAISPIKVPNKLQSPTKSHPPTSPSTSSTPPMLINSQEASDATQNTATPTQHSTEDHSQDFEEAPKKKSPRTPRTPATPLTPAINLNPPDYRYVIELLKKPETKLQVGPKNLSRPRGVLTPKKMKLFLRNALHKPSEKHPLFVKEEYIQKFSLGPSTTPSEPLPTPTPTSRKRSLSQASLDTFFTPNASETKKSRPTSLDTSGKPKRTVKKSTKTPSKGSKTKKGKMGRPLKNKSPGATSSKSPSKTQKLSKTPKSPKRMKSPLKTPKSPKTPRSKIEALKLLNKAKKFKQTELKKNIITLDPRMPLSEEQIAEMRRRAEEERVRKETMRELEKQRRKEERLARLRELKRQRMVEKQRQVEWLKPREDLQCEDSKPLPRPVAVSTQLPLELFGDNVMLLEFLHTFGPLFNIREAIHGGITFETIEYALVSSDTSSILFDIIRFLLQAIFATMEEEKESYVEVVSGETNTFLNIMEEELEEKSKEGGSPGQTVDGKAEEKSEPESEEGGERGVEDAPLSDEDVDTTQDGEVEKPLDVRVESIKASALTFAKWSHLTQHAQLSEMALDPYTCTEILRLHLLSSGGYTDSGDRSWFRHAKRAGYTDSDDPAIALRLRRPDIIESLARTSIYSLTPADKVEVLSTLCSQLLSYSITREHIEDAAMRAKRARKLVRKLQFSEERRKKEEKSALHKEKMRQKREEKEKRTAQNTSMDDGTVAVQPPTADTSATSVEPESDEKTGPSQHEGSKMEGEGDTVPTQEPELKQKRWRRSKDENGKREMREVETAMDQETEEERKARIEEELASLEEEIAEASSAVNLRPLGVDRHHRRYWIFPSLPGLFVEDTGHFPTEEAAQPVKSETPPELQVELPMARPFLPHSAIVSPTKATPTKRLPPPLIHIDNIQASKLLDMDSPSPEKEDKAQSQTPESEEVLTPSAVQQQQQAHAAQSNHLSWSCFTTTEDVDSLISSLNPRGQREVELKKSLESQRSVVLQGITRCPFRPNTTSRSSPSPQQKYCNADEYLELYLREQILDIEEKIYVGNLGYMKDVKDRSEWREAIETSGAAATQSLASTLEAPPQPSIASRPESPAPEDGGRTKSGIATPLVNPAVQELSRALLSVQGGIEKKYLMPPLGFAVDEKQKQKQKGSKKNGVVKGSRICLDQWRASLAKATSFSQIFVHLATLERAVMWSRSLMNMRCRICRRKGGDEYMLLCDGCDHGYHTYCLRPPLLSVPRGDWFCNNCRPVTPVKPRRRAQRVVIVEEESSESEEEGEGEGGSEEEDSEEEENEQSEEDQEEVVTMRRTLRTKPRSREPFSLRRSGRLQHNEKPPKITVTKNKAPGRKRARRVTFSTVEPDSGRKRSHKTPEAPSSYENTKARKKLKLDDVPLQHVSQSRAETVIASIIDLKCSQNAKQQTSAGRREQQGLEMQLCEALWEELNGRDDSWPFSLPVKKREYPDYYDVIQDPMNLKTIRSKIKCGKYDSIDEFLQDTELIFSNCFKYHKRHSEIGKAGSSLKRFFEKRCNDLGLRDLGISLRPIRRRRK